MAFPFGVSVSDFIAGIKLVKGAIEATSDTRGARSDFAELSRSLTSLDRSLNSILAIELDTDGRREALRTTVADCRECFIAFLVDTAKFRYLKDEYATKGRLLTNLRRIQWALCKKEEVRKFRAELQTHIGAVEMLLLAFQMYVLSLCFSRFFY